MDQKTFVSQNSPPSGMGRLLQTHLTLQVYRVDESGCRKEAGSTFAGRAVPVPDVPVWLVEPIQSLAAEDWDALLGLMRDMRIPGLFVEGQMTDDLLQRITQLEHLTYLALEGCDEVTDAGLAYLAHLSHLEHLSMACRKITDAGLSVLRHLPRLRSFSFQHHQSATDDGFTHLESCQLLERVNLMGPARAMVPSRRSPVSLTCIV